MLVTDNEDTRAARRAASRTRILEAAWDLAARDGIAAISLRDVARRVGMRAPSLYNYFPSKNAMYDAMFAEAATEVGAAVAGRPDHPDARRRLRGTVGAFVSWCVANPMRYQLVMERPIPGFEPSPQSFAITVANLEIVRADLEAAGVATEKAIDLFRALITGVISLQVANDPGGDRWTRLVDDAIDMFLAHHTKAAGALTRPKRGGTRS